MSFGAGGWNRNAPVRPAWLGARIAGVHSTLSRTPLSGATETEAWMTKHSKRERERRDAETERVKQIEAAWMGSLPPATANAFAQAVEAARARGPEPKRPDMAPGTAPRPPRPGREPREPKEPARPRRNY
jgi:hypothetical protein